jgi:uncharacterized protein
MPSEDDMKRGTLGPVRWLLTLAVAACGSTAPVCELVPRVPKPQPFLWKAQKADGPIVWFYGTIHNASGDDVPQVAWAALESSPTVLTEVGDEKPSDPTKIAELARLPPGKGLDQQLPASDWYDLRDALRGKMKEAELARARPWYAMSRLGRVVAPPPDPTMDFAIAKRARAKGKPVVPLESWEAQLAALADTVKIPDLQQALHERKTMRCTLDKMKSLYMTGDQPAMTKLLVIAQTNKLVVDRSKAWMVKLEPYFANGGAFVAVGLGHLLGDEGLPAMLERAGYQVERVK